MIDARILPMPRTALQPAAQFLANRGIGADIISLAGFVVGLGVFVALCFAQWPLALTLILLNRLFDGLGGAVACLQGPRARGAFLDIALDMVFYALIPLGFAVQAPETHALPAAVLIVSFVGAGSSFLALSAVAAKLGRKVADFPTRGIYCAGGLAQGFETTAVFVTMCLFPAKFTVIAYGLAVLCTVTTVIRWRQGWGAFSGAEQ